MQDRSNSPAAVPLGLAPGPMPETDANEIIVETADGTLLTRETRRGFGESQQPMAYAERPGFHRHWFNDVPGRLLEARRAGYTQVMGPDGSPVVLVADKTTGMLTYLHEIPIPWYKDDLKKGQDAADQMDASIRDAGNALGPDGKPVPGDTSNRYGKVTISRQRAP